MSTNGKSTERVREELEDPRPAKKVKIEESSVFSVSSQVNGLCDMEVEVEEWKQQVS